MVNKRYVYNPAQANFYMSKGISCLGTGLHDRTKNVFYIFLDADVKEAYFEWCERNRRRK